MAAATERLFPCSDCGATSEERAAMGDKMNYIHTRRINGNVHFLGRCRACHWKAIEHAGNKPLLQR